MKHGVKHLPLNNPSVVAEIQQGAEIFGIPVSVDRKSPHLARARGVWPFKRITVNPDWFRLPYGEQQAVLAHEAGHCLGFHLEIRIALLPLCWTKRVQKIARDHEYAADAFAARAGWGVDLLQFVFRSRMAAHPFYPSTHERAQRLAHMVQEMRYELAA
jgi:hypothetical protein